MCTDFIRAARGVELIVSEKNPYLTPQKIKEMRDLLAYNPIALVEKNKKHLPEKLINFDGVPACTDELQIENPLCYLAECWSWKCPVARLNCPGVRREYEKSVSQISSNVIADVGSSYLMQAAVVLERKLRKNPSASVVLYLIDPIYEKYVMQEGRTLDVVKTNFDESVLDRSLYQFTTFFAQAYPDAELFLFLYKSVDDFIDDCQKGIVQVPDTVLGSDFNYIELKEVQEDFEKLVQFCVEEKSSLLHSVLLLGCTDRFSQYPVLDVKRWEDGKLINEDVFWLKQKHDAVRTALPWAGAAGGALGTFLLQKIVCEKSSLLCEIAAPLLGTVVGYLFGKKISLHRSLFGREVDRVFL